jgi:hypothetical protein
MATEIEILKAAYKIEDPNQSGKLFGSWESHRVGATRSDIIHLQDAQLICRCQHVKRGQDSFNLYKLTSKGINVLKGYSEENEAFQISANEVINAMDMVVGYKDIKEQIAMNIEAKKQAHLLFYGPPASAKSVILESVRGIIPNSVLAFGSRTSAPAIADQLFEQKPSYYLLDEIDKVGKNEFSVLLGLMQSGEVIETKTRKTRGVILKTVVMAAANDEKKLTPELWSRFIQLYFPAYNRTEFIDVTVGYLARSENCPTGLGKLIGTEVYDRGLGDVRKGRQIWMMMAGPVESEVYRVINLMSKYSPPTQRQSKQNLAQAVMAF